MNEPRDRRTPQSKPTEERTADQSTQQAGALHEPMRGIRPGPGPEVAHEEEADEVLERSAEERYDTPRQYERTQDPALPADDATLKTKI